MREREEPVEGQTEGADPTVVRQSESSDAEDSQAALSRRVLKLTAQSHAKDRYSIAGEIGRGGMGAIVRVYDQDLCRNLAMKVILDADVEETPHGATPLPSLVLARFLEEAQVTGQLDHPGVVPVHELGVNQDGRMYFTMRLVRGSELRTIIEKVHDESDDEWTMSRALGVILKVCETMAYAHDKGVIHRDLKPANIMVGKYGEVYVMDWGLALTEGRRDFHDLRIKDAGAITVADIRTDRQSTPESSHHSPLITVDGSVVGTPYYMPPEQALGRLEDIGPHSDVYAVGAMLYHLLTGEHPYHLEGTRSTPGEVLARVLAGPPTPVHELTRSVPLELQAICDKAMAREPKDRYLTMGRLAEDLRRYLEGRVVLAYKTGPIVEIRKWVKRNRALAASVAAAIVLAFAGLGSTAYVQAREREVADENAARALQATAEAERALARAEAQSYVANVAAASVNLEVGNAPEARRRLDACPEEHRGWEWRHLDLKQDLGRALGPGFEDEVNVVAVGPNGSYVAAAAWDTIRVWNAETGELIADFEGHTDQILSLGFSPDGRRVVSDSWDGTVRLWDLESREELAAFRISDPSVPTARFSPRGALVAAASGDETVHVWDASSGVIRALLRRPPGSGAIRSLSFDPAGRLLATGSADPGNSVHVWSVDTQETVAVLRGHERSVNTLAFSPDGGRIVSGSSDNTVRVWEVAADATALVLEGHEQTVSCVTFDASGERIASGSMDGAIQVWDARSGARLHTLQGTGWIADVRFSPDGGWLFSESLDGSVLVWDAEGGGAPVAELREADESATCIAGSPDGTFVVTGSQTGNVTIWCAGTRRGFATLAGHEAEVRAATFTADGSRVVSGSSDGTVRVWDGLTGEPLATLCGHADSVRDVAVLPRDGRIVSASDDGTVRLWDANGGEPRTLEGHEDWVACVAVGPAGRRIASGGEATDPTVRLWDAATGAALAVGEGHEDSVLDLAFTGDGTRIVSGSADGTLRVWDAASVAELRVIEAHDGPVRAVAIAPDGATLISGGDDHEVRVWSLESGELLAALRGHEAEVLSVALDPLGERILSASADWRLRVWDAESGVTLSVLAGHEGPVASVAFGPDGERVLSASFDGTIRVWETQRAVAEGMWRGITRRRMVTPVVERLLADLGDVERVVEHLQGRPGLDPALRDSALRLTRMNARDYDARASRASSR